MLKVGEVRRQLLPLVQSRLVSNTTLAENGTLVYDIVPLNSEKRVFIAISYVVDHGLTLVLQIN